MIFSSGSCRSQMLLLRMTTNNRCVLLEAREFDTLRPMKLLDSAILT
jgi:hypothetical protein